MATATATKPKPASKPAKAGSEGGMGIKELAAKLGTDPRSLRKFIRGMDLGVGRGERYEWSGPNDSTVKRIAAAWRKAQAAQPVE